MSDYDRYSVYIDPHVKKGIINIDQNEYKKFRKGLGKNYENRMINEITHWIQTNHILYPSLKNMINFDVVHDSFTMLKKNKKKFIHPVFQVNGVDDTRLTLDGKYYIILIQPEYYVKYGYIIDFSQDDPSNKKFWQNNSKDIVTHSIKKYKAITSETLRMSLRELYKNEINQFNILVAQTLMKVVKCTRVLDPFMGRGEKLLAALSIDKIVSYQGVNPDYEPFEGYKSMCEFNRKDYRVPMSIDLICKEFTQVDVLKTCDVIFANPIDITTNKLIECLRKAWLVLESKGHLILSVQIQNIDVILNIIDNFPNCQYRGCIGYANDLSTDKTKEFSDPRPAYIWRKV